MKKEIPILFSTPMVLAKLEGRKTMTRRVVKGKALQWLEQDGFTPEFVADPENGLCPYGKPGDWLYTRETWQHTDCINLNREDENAGYIYKALENGGDWESNIGEWAWKPSIHLPKNGSRIWDEVVSVRIERLHDITEADAVAEGILKHEELGRMRYKDYMADASGYGHPNIDYPTVGLAKTSFATLWEKINGKESWDANPWVWVVEFKVLSTTGKPNDI